MRIPGWGKSGGGADSAGAHTTREPGTRASADGGARERCPTGWRFAVIESQFNGEITRKLGVGAREAFAERGVEEVDFHSAPGAFELPLIAKMLARSGRYQGVVALGCVVKGETAHFEFISLGAAVGLQLAQLECEVPISFGVLTVYEARHAIARSEPGAENKGAEAAHACVDTALALSRAI